MLAEDDDAIKRSDDGPRDHPPRDGESSELLRQFAGGDDRALSLLVERESPRLLRRIRQRLPHALRRRVGESDILQLTSMDLLAVRKRFENRGLPAFRGLLDTIADINVARVLERERAQKRNIDAEHSLGASESRADLDDFAGSASSPSSPMHREESAAILEGCFALLREADREVIRLIDYEEVGYEEGARRLGIEEEALRRRHSRAIGRLRELMGRGRKT